MAKQNTDANFYLNVTQYIEGWNIRSAPKKQARVVNKMASYNDGKLEVIEYIMSLAPASILDVGACDGKWSQLR